MVSEDFVTNSIMKFLQNRRWQIIQYHPPGGQACMSIKILGDVVVPDIIAYKPNNIIVIENKPRFNVNDIDKLIKMMSDEEVIIQIRDYIQSCRRARGLLTADDELIIYWAHGYSGKLREIPLRDINLINVTDEGNITVTNSINSPLIP